MRKVSLLLGTLGGALGAYVLNNPALRKELGAAKSADAAAKSLGKHLQKDSKKLVKEVKDFVDSDDVQKKLEQAKKFTMKKYDDAKKSAASMMKKGGAKAGNMMKREAKVAGKSMKKAAKKVNKAAHKVGDKVGEIVS